MIKFDVGSNVIVRYPRSARVSRLERDWRAFLRECGREVKARRAFPGVRRREGRILATRAGRYPRWSF